MRVRVAPSIGASNSAGSLPNRTSSVRPTLHLPVLAHRGKLDFCSANRSNDHRTQWMIANGSRAGLYGLHARCL